MVSRKAKRSRKRRHERFIVSKVFFVFQVLLFFWSFIFCNNTSYLSCSSFPPNVICFVKDSRVENTFLGSQLRSISYWTCSKNILNCYIFFLLDWTRVYRNIFDKKTIEYQGILEFKIELKIIAILSWGTIKLIKTSLRFSMPSYYLVEIC